MNKATFVVFGLLLSILFASPLQAADLLTSITELEGAWATTYYQDSEEKQKLVYPVLMEKAGDLVKRYPQAAEPKIWYANLLATNAGLQSSIYALSSLDTAKTLLEEAIKQNPQALEGAAYVTLGTLYYKVPAWPVSFGNNLIAEQLLKTSLKINPGGIDANYFYADFLIQQDRISEAEEFLERAMHARVRPQQIYADSQLQNVVKNTLAKTKLNKQTTDNNRFMSLSTSTNLLSK